MDTPSRPNDSSDTPGDSDGIGIPSGQSEASSEKQSAEDFPKGVAPANGQNVEEASEDERRREAKESKEEGGAGDAGDPMAVEPGYEVKGGKIVPTEEGPRKGSPFGEGEEPEERTEAQDMWMETFGAAAELEGDGPGLEESYGEDAPQVHFMRALDELEPREEDHDTALYVLARLLDNIDKPRLLDRVIEEIRERLLQTWSEEEHTLEDLPAPVLVERAEKMSVRFANVIRRLEQGAHMALFAEKLAIDEGNEAARYMKGAAGEAERLEKRLADAYEELMNRITGGFDEELKGTVQDFRQKMNQLYEAERQQLEKTKKKLDSSHGGLRETAVWLDNTAKRHQEDTEKAANKIEENTEVVEKLHEKIEALIGKVQRERRARMKTGIWGIVGGGMSVAAIFLIYMLGFAAQPSFTGEQERQMQMGREMQGVLSDSTITDQERNALEQKYKP